MSPSLIVRAIGSALALPDLAFNEDGVCCVFIPGELELQFEWIADSSQLLLLAPLGDLGDDADGSRSRALLAANFLFNGTRGESLSLEPGSGKVYLCAMRDMEADTPERLVEWITGFVDTAQQWRLRLASDYAAQPDPHAPIASMPHFVRG